MNERRKTGSLPVYDIMHRWGVGGSNLGQTQIWICLFNFVRSFPLQVRLLIEGFASLSLSRYHYEIVHDPNYIFFRTVSVNTGSCPYSHPVALSNGLICCASLSDAQAPSRSLQYMDTAIHCSEDKRIICPDLPDQVCEELNMRKNRLNKIWCLLASLSDTCKQVLFLYTASSIDDGKIFNQWSTGLWIELISTRGKLERKCFFWLWQSNMALNLMSRQITL